MQIMQEQQDHTVRSSLMKNDHTVRPYVHFRSFPRDAVLVSPPPVPLVFLAFNFFLRLWR
jgi:hypothetical protein